MRPNVRPEREGHPRYTGIASYRDPQGRFTFKHAAGWARDKLAEDRDGVIAMPDPDDPATHFAVWLTRLDEHIAAEDLDVLAEGLDAGLADLPGFELLESKNDALGNLVKLERRYTFVDSTVDPPETRKRRAWTMYVDVWQMVVLFQGATVEEFDYWEPMGNFAFARFELPPELWFATDRDLSGWTERSPTDAEEQRSD